MKKSLLLMIPAAVLMLASCGPTVNPTEPESQDPTTEVDPGPTTTEEQGPAIPTEKQPRPEGGFIKEPVTIDFWHSFSKDKIQPKLQTLVDDFMAAEPNVTVNLAQQEGGYSGLRTNIINGFSIGQYPDLAVCYPDHVADYIDYGYAQRIDTENLMNDMEIGWPQSLRDDIIDAYWNEGCNYRKEGVYSMPFAKSAEMMYYNEKTLIGLDLSKEDPTINGGLTLDHDYINNLTWEELFGKLCPAIIAHNDKIADAKDKIFNTSDDGKYGIVAYDSSDNLFITLAIQYGIPFTTLTNGKASVDFNTPKMRELMLKLREAKDNHYFITQTLNGTYTNALEEGNKCLFSIGSTAGTSHHSSTGNMAAAKIPHAENGTEAVIQQGPSLCILDNHDVNRAKAAWLLYDFLAENDNMLYWCEETNYNPYRKSALQTDRWFALVNEKDDKGNQKTGLPLLLAKVNTILEEYNDWFFTTPAFKGSADVRKLAGGLLDQCMVEAELKKNIEKLFNDTIEAAKGKIA